MQSIKSKVLALDIIFFISFFAHASVSLAGTLQKPQWHPPERGVVRDAKTAISVARLIWFSINPELGRSDDLTWQSGMIATSENGVWKVVQKPSPKGHIGGGLEIDISGYDGRVVGIYLTQ